jgi:hypothetical protein
MGKKPPLHTRRGLVVIGGGSRYLSPSPREETGLR